MGERLYSVTEVISYFDIGRNIPQDRIKQGAFRGNEVHKYCLSLIAGEWYPRPKDYLGYCESFMQWFENYVKEVFLIEKRLEDKTLGFYGIPDLIVKIKGNEKPCIVDLKTPASKNKLWRAQISAYTHLAIKNGFMELSPGGSLRLKEDGSYPKFDIYNFQYQDFAAFVSLLNWVRWLNE